MADFRLPIENLPVRAEVENRQSTNVSANDPMI
jgi:hypothetical protein